MARGRQRPGIVEFGVFEHRFLAIRLVTAEFSPPCLSLNSSSERELGALVQKLVRVLWSISSMFGAANHFS